MSILGKILYVTVLLLNSIVVLSQDRFLARINFTPATHRRSFGDNADDGVKAKMIQLVASVRTLMKIPLVIVNILMAIYELVLG